MTDHGISHARGKQFLYDEGTHVPFVVRGPGIAKGSGARRSGRAHRPGRHLARRRGHRDSRRRCRAQRLREGLPAARRRVRRPRPLRRDGRAHPQRAHRPLPVHPQLPSRSARTCSRTPTRTASPSCRRCARCTRPGSSTRSREKLLFSPTRPPEELYEWTTDRWQVKNLAADPAHAKRWRTCARGSTAGWKRRRTTAASRSPQDVRQRHGRLPRRPRPQGRGERYRAEHPPDEAMGEGRQMNRRRRS